MAFFFLRWNQTKYLLSIQYSRPDLCACQSPLLSLGTNRACVRTFYVSRHKKFKNYHYYRKTVMQSDSQNEVRKQSINA